ncbi:HEAT repeat domain-containing protein [Streptomyces qinzhouensis]|uniref:Uncharacterized protein n=1 Tax=Streptomyces qinzhouensis TaxID=2599401 RepID=A0A5B8JJL4_9ACTN|nr:HEAT repeat domain-containing protein [Streptomyces qinzhouensis]QDY77743.1 hypothetical protein FQU76_15895 [Streptomyces qinzhouensis]
MPGSASRPVGIPDHIPPGPLRAWLEWLAELRMRAGMPSLSEVARKASQRGDNFSTATVRRLLVGETTSYRAAQALAYAMADMDRRPVAGKPSDDWDAFDTKLNSLLSGVIENRTEGPIDREASPLESEHSVLLAATRLTDKENRKTALRTLFRRWPHSTKTRDALSRLTRDEQKEIRHAAAHGLALAWPGDVAARETLVNALRDDDQHVQIVAVWGLAKGWAGDLIARDALTALTLNESAQTRELAAEGLAGGWAGDPITRDALLPLTQDEVQTVRETAVEVLITYWPGDPVVRDALLTLLKSNDFSIREIATESLASGWPDDAIVKNSMSALLRDPAPVIRWAAERALSSGQNSPDSFRSARTEYILAEESEDPGVNDGDAHLIALRLPRDFSTEKPLPAVSALHRGIGLDSPITFISGTNGSGKSILLAALGLRLGCIDRKQKRRLTYLPPLALELASRLDLLWREQPAPEECSYISEDRINRHDLPIDPKRHRLALIDNWMPSLNPEMANRQMDALRRYTENGCQAVIIANPRNFNLTNERIIKFGDRRMRDTMQDLIAGRDI